ncbi:MAG: hypothetical protein PHW40_03040 [Candidatus Izemoplasmatales bacterium]|nr:hypothetical protein [Candidatus Izemoplasmatales bacterium]MDD5293271.1 hypothetical protein [Candidatus Izemoplasmatales bacterium]
MKQDWKDLPKRLHDLGLSVVEKTKKGIKQVKESIENTVLEDQLRKRFNLENPYKFQLVKPDRSLGSWIQEQMPRHAKRYDEDDLFVFYGSIEQNGFSKGEIIKDLSDEAMYKIVHQVEVCVSVRLDEKAHDVVATAVSCELL